MKLFDADVLAEIDRATCEAQEIDSLDLMERAANAVTVELISRFLPSRRFVVVAGPGNNGGDALAVARMLIEQGYRRVEVFLFNIKGQLTHDCDEERKKLIQLDEVDFTEVTKEFNPPYLSKGDVVIDGMFGSGLRTPMQGGFAALARYINESGAYVVSIDTPSGLFTKWNDNAVHRDMVHADLTLCMQFPRVSFFLEDNADVVGEWKVLDIDLDPEAIKAASSEFRLVEERSVRPLLRKRADFSAKRDYGSVLLMAGSMGMMGAAVLAARGALRSGAGLVTVHSAHCGVSIVQTAVPEAMFEPDRGERFIQTMPVHHAHSAVVVGPGIGTQPQTIDALETLLKTCKCPLVLDADALNCIARKPALLSMLPADTVITPHAGEFDRLFGENESAEARLRKAIEVAQYYHINIVLKGHHTATVRRTGTVYFNNTGNPGMATAGSGDVLTGIIAAFIAQGYEPAHAAFIGVFIHGLAGDMAAEELGEFGLTAGDIALYSGRAIRRVMKRK